MTSLVRAINGFKRN